MAVDVGDDRPTEKPRPPNCEMMPKTGSSVVSSPMKIGLRSANGGRLINSRTAIGFVYAGRLDLHDQFSGQDFDRVFRGVPRK